MSDTGENIRRLREEHGWTQKELAAISGVSEKYISSIERGERGAGRRTIDRFCDAFAVTEEVIRFGGRKGKLAITAEDMAILGKLKNSPEMYLCAQEMVKLPPDAVFYVRESIRLMLAYPNRPLTRLGRRAA